ncbi:MAG: protein-S-isoprenylcysteine O-methyltransferase [Candidatus Thorarchaeota archaeon]|jgi:protein-S-isoprenylcysteine O-methyltransferase Ste14
MEEIFYRIALGVLIIAFFLIRAPSVISASKTEKVEDKKPARERLLVLLNFIGMLGIPVIYILTNWLDYFTFSLHEFFRFFGIIFFVTGLILLAWVHKTLGQHWSMMLKLGEEHKLVTAGPYASVRHPMYTFFYIMVIATALISANLIVGVFGIATWTLLYMVRVGDEESMLLEQFGEEYREYMERTGRLLPKLKK